MKRFFCLLMILFLFVSFSACSKPLETEDTASDSAEPTPVETPAPTPAPTVQQTPTTPLAEDTEQTSVPAEDAEALDPNMAAEIADPTLRTAILSTLSALGKPVEGTIKVSDMLALEELAIASFAWEAQMDVLNEISMQLSSPCLIILGDGIQSLEGLQYAQNLKRLVILGNPPHIEGGTDNPFQDLSPLQHLDQLELLSLRFNNLHDITPIANLHNLKQLELQYNPELQNISAISFLNNLTVLDLQHCYQADFSAISGLTNLESLYLCGSIRVMFLSELTNLKHLESREGDAVDVWALYGLQNLEVLDLSFQHINDIGPLRAMSKLKVLNLFSNEITDISLLAELEDLQVLAIDQSTYNSNKDTVNTLKANGCQIYTEDIFPNIVKTFR